MLKFLTKWGTTEYATPDGKNYSWHYKPRSRRSPPSSTLSITAPLPFNFSIEREKFYHWLIKRLGLATEFQTNQTDFDRKFYIFSDDAQFCNLLRGAEMRQRIQRLFDLGARELKAEKGKLKALMQKSNAAPDPLTANELAGLLYTLYEQAARIPVSGLLTPGKTMATLASITHGFMIGLLVVGIVATALQPYKMMEYLPMVYEAMPYTLVIAIILFLVLRIMFQESSRGITIFLSFLFAGLPGIAFCSYMAIYAVNVLYDRSQAEIHSQYINKKHFYHGKKSSARYCLYTTNWRYPNQSLCLETDTTTYHMTRVGDRVSIYTRPGYLGHEWIETFEIGQ